MSVDRAEPQKVLDILAVDDEKSTQKLYEALLQEGGHSVSAVLSGTEALEKIDTDHFDLVILDLQLPDIHGTEVLKKIRQKSEDITVIIVTGNPSIDSSIEAVRAGVYDYIVKPFGAEELRIVVARAVEKAKLTIENKRLLQKLQRANPALTERVDELEKCACIATNYEKEIMTLRARIKELEAR